MILILWENVCIQRKVTLITLSTKVTWNKENNFDCDIYINKTHMIELKNKQFLRNYNSTSLINITINIIYSFIFYLI
nr:hypothetical protein Itr_chr15CG02240 [Ipomoea trifida]